MQKSLWSPAGKTMVGGLLVVLSLTACGSDSPPKESSSAAAATGTSSDPSTGSTAASTTAKGAKSATVAVPADVCALIPASKVGPILSETVEARPVPGGGCTYSGESRDSRYPTITYAKDFAGAGGIDGAKAGAEAALQTKTTPITVNGASGFTATGNVGSSSMTQAAVSTKGLIITVSAQGGDAASNAPVITKLLELAVAAV